MTFIKPAYGSRSLSDLLPAVAAALGTPLEGGTEPGLQIDRAHSYVVMLIDGLGYHQLVDHAYEAPYLNEFALSSSPGTATAPSTTATSMTSLGTGRTPGEHGVVGFTQRVPETGELLNSLSWNRDVDPRVWQPLPTVFEQLAKAGVTSGVVSRPEFENSGLTACALRGADYWGAQDARARKEIAVEAAAVRGSLTFVYDSDLDFTGHVEGVSSRQWRNQLAAISQDVADLREALPDHTGLVVTADHGMVDCPSDNRIDIDEVPELREGLSLLGGEARLRHLYCRAGAGADVQATWTESLKEGAVVMTREEALAEGWFGVARPGVSSRIGELVVATTGSFGIFSSRDFTDEMTLVGLHGSFTDQEMHIPMLQVR